MRIDGLANQETLRQIALEGYQMVQLRLGFDTFHHHLQPEIMGQQDDRIQDHRSAIGFKTGLQEGTIHLECIERQAPQIGQ